MIDLVFKNYTSPRRSAGTLRGRQKAPGYSFFKKILETVARGLKLKRSVEVSVNLVSESKIRELNRKYRKKDKPTDVLSFPLNPTFHVPHSTFQDFGDIFICLSIAKKEAKRENISIEKKLAQLTVHGFLHLSGYDHEISKKYAKEMFGLESKILKEWKF